MTQTKTWRIRTQSKRPTKSEVIRILVDELNEIKEWALIEKAPLRAQEIASIHEKIELGKKALR